MADNNDNVTEEKKEEAKERVQEVNLDEIVKACREKDEKLKELEDKIFELKLENIKLKEQVRKESEILSREVERRFLTEKSKLLREFLEILDNFERATQNMDESENESRGLTLIKTQIEQFLSSQGVKEIELEGKTFDPNICEIGEVIEVEDEEKANKILKVMRKGYYLGDTILRTVVVSVAVPKNKDSNNGGE